MAEFRAKVLVVDDDVAFGGMIAEVLSERRYEVLRFSDPRDAVARARLGDFNVAVVDLKMPHLSGIEVVDHLRTATPETQVIILTGQGDMASALEGIRQGVFAYLQKDDIRIDLVERTVESAAEKAALRRRSRELMERLQESNRLLRALQAISTTLAAETHLDLLLGRVVDAAKQATRATAARALLFDTGPDGDLLIARGEGDDADTLRGVHLGRDEGIAVLAAQTGTTIAVEDPKAHPRYSHHCDSVRASPGYVCAPLRHRNVLGVIVVAGSEHGAFTAEEQEVLGSLARQAAVAIDNAEEHERSLNFFTHTSNILVSVLEDLDIHSAGQSRGVAALSDMVSRRMGLSEVERRNIHYGALLRDIGMVRIDHDLLKEPGLLSEEKRRALERHTTLGMEMLKPVTLWEGAVAIIHAHHERWDGKGYPRGLAGEQIPLGARIVAVADAFVAMGRDRPYRRKRAAEEQLKELADNAGTQFDTRVVRMFVDAYREYGDPRTSSQ
jgi:response regulator RpfG family c-di-GMP phosphodiesterase